MYFNIISDKLLFEFNTHYYFITRIAFFEIFNIKVIVV